MRTFKKHLQKELKDPKFKELYQAERELTAISIMITETRSKYGLTQKELAKKAHITQQQLSKVENGVNCNMTTFLKVCNALGMTLRLGGGNKEINV